MGVVNTYVLPAFVCPVSHFSATHSRPVHLSSHRMPWPITQTYQNRSEEIFSAVFKLVYSGTASLWRLSQVKSSLLLTLCLSLDSATNNTCDANMKMDLRRTGCNVR
jgi:hypothetical protein